MTLRIAINGFGRIGRLALRAAWDWPELDIIHVNEIAGDAAAAAHLLVHDSVQGTWPHRVESDGDRLCIDGRALGYSRNAELAATPWRDLGVDLVVDCTGRASRRRRWRVADRCRGWCSRARSACSATPTGTRPPGPRS